MDFEASAEARLSMTSEEADGRGPDEGRRGQWQNVDTTLVERNGALELKYAAADVQLSDGGLQVFAAMTDETKDLQANLREWDVEKYISADSLTPKDRRRIVHESAVGHGLGDV